MCNSLLEFYQSKKFSDFYFAVIEKNYTVDDLEVILKEKSEGTDEYKQILEVIDELKKCADEKFAEMGGDVPKEIKKVIQSRITAYDFKATVFLKDKTRYIDMCTDEPINFEKDNIYCVKPVGDYCKNGRVVFEENAGNVVFFFEDENQCQTDDPFIEYEAEFLTKKVEAEKAEEQETEEVKK